MKKTRLLAIASATALGLAAGSAAAVDVSGLSAEFETSFTTAAAAIGLAMISAAFGAIIYKWIKAMVFGG